jgi:diguanylate cyclase (GGDEF)-like protein
MLSHTLPEFMEPAIVEPHAASLQDLHLALAQADRELAALRRELAEAHGRLAREAAERKLVEESLAAALEGIRCVHWRASVELRRSASGADWLHWDLKFTNDNIVKSWLGVEIDPADSAQTAWGRAIPQDTLDEMGERAMEAVRSGQPGYMQEFPLSVAHGETIWVREETSVEPLGESRWLLTGKCTDITRHKRRDEQAKIREAQARLETLAFRDDLTGLHNRRAFFGRLDLDFERARLYQMPLSVIMIDVDCFKEYNDTYGHPAGDTVLKTIAEVLQANVQDADFVARYGGEELAVVAPCDRGKAMQLAEKLRGAIEEAPWPRGAITASFGVSTFESTHTHPDRSALILEADAALYASKVTGRNRVTHARPEGDVALVEPSRPFHINVGGGAIAGSRFESDAFHIGGDAHEIHTRVNSSGCVDDMPLEIFRTYRAGDFTYRLAGSALGGICLVRLFFVEPQWAWPGERIFSVSIDGQVVLRNFDIIAECGARGVVVVKEFPVAVETGGELEIDLLGQVDGAVLSGLEVVPMQFTQSSAINCGGTDVWPFTGDHGFSGGVPSHRQPETIPADDDPYTFEAGVPGIVYRTERYGAFQYTVAGLPPGANALIVLHFCEVHWLSPGKRAFHVDLNGSRVVSHFDPFTESGGPFIPTIRRFFATADEKGEISLDFIPHVDNAQVAAIEVHW